MKVVAFIPDLLFGSGVLTALQAAGHDAALVGDPEALAEALSGAQVLIVDLTSDPEARIDVAREHAHRGGLRTLAFYSHVEAEVRAQAEEAGFDLVVPRSRMAREGLALVDRLSGNV